MKFLMSWSHDVGSAEHLRWLAEKNGFALGAVEPIITGSRIGDLAARLVSNAVVRVRRPRHHRRRCTRRHRRPRTPHRRGRSDRQPAQRRRDQDLRRGRDVRADDAVRNGNRWQVAAIDTEGNRIAARRLFDGARAVFEDDYVREP
jgi:hypothetical protein